MKTKLILLVLALFLITSCANSQLAVITQTTQEVTVAWDHSGLDTIGAVENMSHFRLWLQHNVGATIFIGSVGADTMEYEIILPDTTGKYVIGVSAVDMSDNESGIHFSTDDTAALGGWYLLFDIIAPALSFGLIRIK